MAVKRNGNGYANGGITAGEILRTLLTVLAAFIPLLAGLWALGIGPIQDDIKEGKRWQNNAVNVFVPKESSNEYRLRVKEQMERAEKDFGRLDQEIKEVIKGHVTQQDLAPIIREINELKTRLGLLYPLDKVLEDMNKRMDRLQTQLMDPNKSIKSTP